MSAKKALENYYRRQLEEQERQLRPKRRNQKPEKEVERSVMGWLNANGFSCHVVESKAVFSKAAGRFIKGQTQAGVADIFGCAPDGTAVFLELKAPGRRSTLKVHQREFLLTKIMIGAFAVCVDSVDLLSRYWSEFEHRRKMDPMLARNFLLRQLPAKADNDNLIEIE